MSKLEIQIIIMMIRIRREMKKAQRGVIDERVV